MPSYLVETFLARDAADERLRRERRAGEAAEALTRSGTHVRFGGSIHVPAEEICFFSFEAPSDRAVTLVAKRAGLTGFRVVAVDGHLKSSPTTSQEE